MRTKKTWIGRLYGISYIRACAWAHLFFFPNFSVLSQSSSRQKNKRYCRYLLSMRVLIVDGFCGKARVGHEACLVERVVRESLRSLVYPFEIKVCPLSNLPTSSDCIDLIIADSAGDVLPWEAEELIALVRQCLDCQKWLLAFGGVALCVAHASATRERLKFANGRCGTSKNKFPCNASKGNRYPRVPHAVCLDCATGDYYVVDDVTFRPAGNVGVYRQSEIVGGHQILPRSWSESTKTSPRVSYCAKLGESCTTIRKGCVQHPIFAGHTDGLTFVTQCDSKWHICDGSSGRVLADDERGSPQILTFDERAWVVRAHVQSHGPTRLFIKNFVQTSYAQFLGSIPPYQISCPNRLVQQRACMPPKANASLPRKPSRMVHGETISARRDKLVRLARSLGLDMTPGPDELEATSTVSDDYTRITPKAVSHKEDADKGWSNGVSTNFDNRLRPTEPHELRTSQAPAKFVRLKAKSAAPYCAHRKFCNQAIPAFFSVVNDGAPYLTPHEQEQKQARLNKARWVTTRNFFSTIGVASAMPLRPPGGVVTTGPFADALVATALYRGDDKSKFVAQEGWQPVPDRRPAYPNARATSSC